MQFDANFRVEDEGHIRRAASAQPEMRHLARCHLGCRLGCGVTAGDCRRANFELIELPLPQIKRDAARRIGAALRYCGIGGRSHSHAKNPRGHMAALDWAFAVFSIRAGHGYIQETLYSCGGESKSYLSRMSNLPASVMPIPAKACACKAGFGPRFAWAMQKQKSIGGNVHL